MKRITFFRKVALHFSELVTAKNIYIFTDEEKIP